MLQFACEHRRSTRNPHPNCELCREASQIPLCTPQETCKCCSDLRFDSWNILLRARRKQIQRKQRKEEAACTMTDIPANSSDEQLLDSQPSIPRTDSVPLSQGDQDIVTQVKVTSQSKAHYSDVSYASDKPTHVEVESTGMYSSEEDEASDLDFGQMTHMTHT